MSEWWFNAVIQLLISANELKISLIQFQISVIVSN